MAVRTYEGMLILHPDLPDSDVQNFLSDCHQTIQDFNGTLIKSDVWGKRRLAYRIKKSQYGIYVVVYFSGQPALVDEFKRRFRIAESVLKYLVLRIEQDQIKDKSYYVEPPQDERGYRGSRSDGPSSHRDDDDGDERDSNDDSDSADDDSDEEDEDNG